MNIKRLVVLALSVFLVVPVVLAGGCTGQGDTGQEEPLIEQEEPLIEQEEPLIVDVTPPVAYALIRENTDNQNFVIIDVRTPEEYAEGHIEEAVNLDYSSEAFEGELDKLDRDKTYLICCQTGRRSRVALNIMEDLDFSEVYHIDDGIVEWEKLGFPVVK
ncbi:rhodanese-like domain-containing protein [Chloroflexota bacterium]